MGVLYKVMDPFYVSLQMSARYDSLITLWTLDTNFYGWHCILNIECKSRDIHFFPLYFLKTIPSTHVRYKLQRLG